MGPRSGDVNLQPLEHGLNLNPLPQICREEATGRRTPSKSADTWGCCEFVGRRQTEGIDVFHGRFQREQECPRFRLLFGD